MFHVYSTALSSQPLERKNEFSKLFNFYVQINFYVGFVARIFVVQANENEEDSSSISVSFHKVSSDKIVEIMKDN